MKYNDNSELYQDWTTKKLKAEYKSLDQLIYQVECYGTSDLLSHLAVGKELDKRGVEINREVEFN